MKKIIIFSTAYLPMIGGAELAVHEIAARLPNFEFDLICARLRRDLRKQEKIGRVNVYRVGVGSRIDKILLPFFGFLKARRLSKDCLSPTSNHLSLVLWGVMASWGSATAWLFKIFYPKVPFLLTLQEGDAEKYIQEGRLGLINIGWRLILGKADSVQVISNYLAEMARKYGYKGAIDVVPNGVDLKKFSICNSQFSKNDFKNTLGLKSDEKIIITVSRLVEKNGMEDLVEGFSKLKINQLKTKLLIIGSGPLEKKIKLGAKNLGLGEKVAFLGDIPNEEVPKYLAISDVFVRPSLSEGLGNSFLEAMAAGVPVVGTPVGGIPDFLEDPFLRQAQDKLGSGQVTGLFCEVKNPNSIAEKIKILLEDDELRNKVINNARKVVEEKYDWNIIASKMAGIFDKIA